MSSDEVRAHDPEAAGDDHRIDEVVRDILIALCLSREVKPPLSWKLAATLENWLEQSAVNEIPGPPFSLSKRQLSKGRRVVARARELARDCERDAERLGASIVTRLDPTFPPKLLDLQSPPSALIIQGDLAAISAEARAVAIVGPRAADPYGLEVTRTFARDLAASEVVVVSGFARGVDACAHQAALDADGRTVAVLGTGIDADYPRGQATLKSSICQTGCVVSELPIGTGPRPWHFPIRNRLIAALGDCTLVVQATHRSGSLLTAGEALELGRDVWAVPGRLSDRRCEGTNRLIRDGAHVALEPQDLIETLEGPAFYGLGEDSGSERTSDDTSTAGDERDGVGVDVLAQIAAGEATAEQLSQVTGLSMSEVLAELLELELRGKVERLSGGLFRAGSSWQH